MRPTDWAFDPQSSPPPIPLTTDVVGFTNPAYAIGAIPPDALADDLAAAGLTYSLGRGHGYKLHGEHIDSYRVGDVIAAIFEDAAAALRYYLGTDEAMLALAVEEARLEQLPHRDRFEDRSAARAAIQRRIADVEARLAYARAELDLAANSLAATARSIRRYQGVRAEALRRFRSAIPAPPPPPAPTMTLDGFLASVPPGPIDRRELHAAALAAGVDIGPRKLYAAVDALGWPRADRRGIRRYRVPD